LCSKGKCKVKVVPVSKHHTMHARSAGNLHICISNARSDFTPRRIYPRYLWCRRFRTISAEYFV